MSGIAENPLNAISKVYLEQVAEAKVEPPKERLKTDRNMFSIPKDEQQAAKERLLAKSAAKRKAAMEALDPVGKEDDDPDNDGVPISKDKNDQYIMKRRKAISAAMKKRMKEERELAEVTKMGVHAPHEVPSGDIKKLVSKAVKRIDADNDGDVDKDDPKEKGMGEFVPSPDGKKRIRTKMAESSDYDPMDDDEFDHDEAEENRGVSGKNNPKGGKSLGKKKKSVKEGFSNWREDLTEVMTDDIDSKPIKEKKVNNKIKINPKLGEAIERLGGTLIEMVEIGEGFVDPEEGEAPSGRRPLDNVIDHPNKNVRKKAIKGMKKQMAKEYGGKWTSKSDDPNESYELEGELVDENVATGKARRAKFGGISQKVGKSEVVTNKEKSAALEKHFAAKQAKEKSAGEAAHKAASAKGLSPAEAEMRRKAAERKAARMRKEEVEQIEEKSIQMQRRVDRYMGRSEAKSKDRLKRQNDRREKKAALAAMEKQYRGMKSGIYSSYEPEGELVDEKLNLKKADMGDVIKDFYKSDAPQFKGRSKEKRREMAIAAKLTAERGGRRLGEGATEAPMTPQELALQKRKTMLDQMIAKKRQQALQKQKEV